MPSEGEGPPKTGWARLVPELIVSDLDASLAFWCEGLGFRVAYSRPGFVYLERTEGAQIMLCQRDGSFETGDMNAPFGRGAMFQVYVAAIAPVIDALAVSGRALCRPVAEVWRRWGDREGGQSEFFVQDPDGYLIMVAEHVGERPLQEQAKS